ncbi:MAG: YidC/Oxa1 family membrane protein insertase [Lachnospiraceae bacterium]|nr:YidC/Oxa1 family membrane protein insertase [Lachnospiraceae bacterium]
MGTILYNIFIIPIEYILEFVYVFLKRIIGNPGYVIIGVSLVVNLLILPIYLRADTIQAEENEKQKSMQGWINRIHKTFSGDERFMILQAYYREMDYKPGSVIKVLLPTILQIPFFIAAFHFLSNLQDLNGAALGPIKNLSAPDALLHIGGVSVNVLPVLMTLINFGSAAIYLRGYPLKNKIQTYLVAAVFLVLLYDSPSGLVFYWTLNNIFSLGKNVVMKFIPVKKKESRETRTEKSGRWEKDMIPAQLVLTILMGLVIPSALIASSAAEFVVTADPRNPVHYVVSTFAVATGYFLVWTSVFCYISAGRIRKVLFHVINIGAVVAVADYMFFGKNLGIISADLFFAVFPHFSGREKMVNMIVIAIIAVLMFLMGRKIPTVTSKLCGVLAGALLIVGLYNVVTINQEITANSYLLESKMRDDEPIFRLSRTGRNIIVFSIDAMIGLYLPYMAAEKPEMKEVYDGFVYYRNTVSCGSNTAIGSPGMLGGYEYIPYYSGQRSDVTIEEKNYEYTTLMPRLFSENGWEVTLCDIPYAGYQLVPDMSIYDDMEGVKGLRTMGFYMDEDVLDNAESVRERNLFWYSLFKITPVIAQTTVYDGGIYFSSKGVSDVGGLYSSHFMEAYEVMDRLDRLSEITDEKTDTFLILNNDIAHDQQTLQLPDYTPSSHTNEGAEEPGYRVDDEGNVFYLAKDDSQPSYYHINMAAFLQIGKFLNYIKEQGVYDNTKIIVVSDHGRSLGEFPDLGNNEVTELEGVNCMLMVKDFDAHGTLSVSDELMCNADVPTIAMEDVIENPVNPYTGNKIDSEKKNDGLYVLYAFDFGLTPADYFEYLYEEQKWLHVEEDVFVRDNWTEIEP